MTEEEYAALSEAEKVALVAELRAKASARSDAEKREIAKRRAKSLHQMRVKFRTRFKRK